MEKNYDIVLMGTDCMGNEMFAPVEIGCLCSATGDVYFTRAQAREALEKLLGEGLAD
jgi:hypothetical protein